MLRLFVKSLQCLLAIVYITVSSHIIEYNIIVSKFLGHFFLFAIVIARRFLLAIITIKFMMDVTLRKRASIASLRKHAHLSIRQIANKLNIAK